MSFRAINKTRIDGIMSVTQCMLRRVIVYYLINFDSGEDYTVLRSYHSCVLETY